MTGKIKLLHSQDGVTKASKTSYPREVSDSIKDLSTFAECTIRDKGTMSYVTRQDLLNQLARLSGIVYNAPTKDEY